MAAQGLVINITYDSSVDGAAPGFKDAVNAAVAYLEATFTNPVTLNFAVGLGEVAGYTIGAGAGGAAVPEYTYATYAQLQAAMPNVGLPAVDPTGTDHFQITNGLAKMLGIATNGAASDGSIGVTALYNLAVDPNNRAQGGQLDAIGILEHELTHVMGRISDSNTFMSTGNFLYSPLDLFRYSAPGQRALRGETAYFSTDGVTLQTQFSSVYGGDPADWGGSVRGDSFGTLTFDTVEQVTQTDIAVMVALGWTTVSGGGGGGAGSGVFANFSPAGGVAQTISCDNAADAAIIRTLLSALPATGALQVNAGGQYAIGAGTSALVDSATTRVTVFGGASAGQRVIAGAGGLAFNAGSGGGTVVAAGGDNLISVYPGAGAQNITTGDGNDTISALAGANTISAGLGRNLILAQGGNNLIISAGSDLISAPDGNATISAGSNAPTIFLGSGASRFNGGAGNATVVVGSTAATLTSAGADQLWMQAGGGVVSSSKADTIIGGAGAVTVNAGGANDFVFAGTGNLKFNGGAGASTILGATDGTASIVGGAGSIIVVAYGATSFTGSSGAATVAAFGGSATVVGGYGGGVFLGGPDGGNRLSAAAGGKVTLIGGGDGDVLIGQASGGDVFQAGGGAETLNGGGSFGMNKFYGGSGADYMILGSGGDQVLAGTGTETIWASFGADLIAFTNGNHPDVTIKGFTAVQNFNPRDYLSLVGFAQGEAARALAAATITAGSENIILSDGTKIQFLGVTGVSSLNFL